MHQIRVGPKPEIALDIAGAGPLVMFLHGIGGNRTNWRDQVAALAPRFTAAAWDARGFGASDDYDGELVFADFAADLARVLDHLGAGRVHLVGLSMGGRVVLDFWRKHPARVATVTFAGTSAGLPGSITHEKREEFLRLREKPLLEGKTPADIAPDVVPALVGPDCPPGARARVLESAASLRSESYLKALRTVTLFDDFPPYESITVPTLVINGDHDQIAPLSMAETIAARVAGAELVVLKGAGHLSNVEQPDAFNAALLDFLGRHAAGADAPRGSAAVG